MLLCVGTLLFWAFAVQAQLPPLPFAVIVAVASALFGVGLAYDALLIGDTEREAASVRDYAPDIASALTRPVPWRWAALALNLGGLAASVPACLCYFRAAQAPAAGRQALLEDANRWWLFSMVFFLSGYIVVCSSVVAMLRGVAQAQGLPEPSLGDETYLMLGLFFVSLAGFTALEVLLVVGGLPMQSGVCMALGGASIAGLTAGAFWQLDSAMRAAVEGEAGSPTKAAPESWSAGLADEGTPLLQRGPTPAPADAQAGCCEPLAAGCFGGSAKAKKRAGAPSPLDF